MVVPKIHSQKNQQQQKLIGKGTGSRRIPLQPQIEEIASSSSNASSSYYIVLLVKIILVLVILFTLPKFVTTTSTTNDRTDDGAVTTQLDMSKIASSTTMKNGSSNNRSSRYRQRQKRFRYKLRSLRRECQNNSTISNCSTMIPEESLNCVNQCISTYCYMKVFNSSITLSPSGNSNNTADFIEDYTIDETIMVVQQQREPLEDGEIDIVRAKEFDTCALEEMMQRYQLQKQQQIKIAA